MQRKIFKKLMAASLAAVMTVGLAACGNNDSGNSTNDSSSSNQESNDNSGESTPETPDNSGESTPDASDEGGEVSAYPVINDPATGEPYDLGGINVVIYSWFTDGTTADEYGEAVTEYHEWLTDTYNFTVERQQLGGWGDCPQALVDYVTTGGDDNYYMFEQHDGNAATSAMQQGLMYDVSTLDCLDFSDAKYAKNGLHEWFSKDGSIYAFRAGDPEPRGGIFFNKRLLTEAGIDPESIYDMQADGTWTWEAFENLLKQVQRDVDSDGVTDVYGLVANWGDYIKKATYSNGGELVGRDADGKYTYRLEDPETIEALEWALNIQKTYGYAQPEGAEWNYFTAAFKDEGKAAFLPGEAYMITQDLKDMEDDFGFVMWPKGPKADGYINNYHDNVLCIPACYDADKAWKIAFAYDLWNGDIPGFEDYDGAKNSYYDGARDIRTVEETIVRMMSENGTLTYESFIPNLDAGNQLLWTETFNNGEVAAACEATRDAWKQYIEDANNKAVGAQ